MKIVDFKSDPELLTHFLEFPPHHYASDPNWLPDPDEARLLKNMETETQRMFLIFNGDQVCGRVSAQINPRLIEPDGTPYAQLGFFECVNDQSAAEQLLSAALDWLAINARYAKTALAPINFDTWHTYRLRTQGFDQTTFPMEPYNPKYYAGLFKALSFTAISQYVTKTVTEPNALQTAWEPYYQDALSLGYKYRTLNPLAKMDEITLIYNLSKKIFKDNLFFIDISKDEFLAMHTSTSNTRIDPDLLIFAIDPQGAPI